MRVLMDTFVGTVPNGDRLKIRIELEDVTCASRTILHEPIDEVVRLSITGEMWEPRTRKEPYAVGQVREGLLAVTSPNGDWTIQDLHDLHDLWERWHLNDMRSHCAHQDRRVKWDECPRCPQTEYKAGSAWLVEPLPVAVMDWLNQFVRKAR